MELFDDMWNCKDIVRDSYLFLGIFFFLTSVILKWLFRFLSLRV
jgi:hypothetical protein